jgi:nucleoside-diphosphate-sugar epimerase
MDKKIFVTGGSGFIGYNLYLALKANHYKAIFSSRACVPNNSQFVIAPELGSNASWYQLLEDVDTVVHLAARAHILRKNTAKDCFVHFQKTNVEGTARLAEEALAAKVKKIIFLSSIGAVAEKTEEVLKPEMQCRPTSLYGQSKLAAEKKLKKIAAGSDMSVIVIRPPLVYGPRNPGNMARLLKIVDYGVPLFLSALDSNRRSFVGISNLIDLILLCLEHPAAANQTFHVSDDEDISTAELLRRMGKALGKPVRNIPIPGSLLRAGLRMVGKGDWVDKLFGDLKVDISETKRILGWKPKVTMGEELERTAKWWREREK